MVAELKLTPEEISAKTSSLPTAIFSSWECKYKISERLSIVSSVAIDPSDRFFVSCDDNDIKLWEINTGEEIASLRGHSDRVRCLSLSLDGKFLVSGSVDRTIKLWNLATKELIRTFGDVSSGHLGAVLSVAINVNGKNLISGSADKTTKIWDVETGKEINSFTDYVEQVTSVAISPDYDVFASASLENNFKFRNINNGEIKRTISENSIVLSVVFSPDGKLLATTNLDRTIKLWNFVTGEVILTLTGHTNRVSNLVFSADGKILVSSSWDKTIKLWQVETGELIDTLAENLAEVACVAISRDNKTIVAGTGDRTIEVWQCQ
ncbi:MAG: WD40 repeat domain-containing protein [Xenococcaceae cyanobacterium]